MDKVDKQIKALDIALRLEKRAINSRQSFNLQAIPYYWEFEDFCKRNGISCEFDFVDNSYILGLI